MPKIPPEVKKRAFSHFTEQAEETGQSEASQPLPHIVIRALAGSGKTTTEIESLKMLVNGTSRLNPSPQQEAIWEEVLKSVDTAKTFCMVAFNSEIVETLRTRIPNSPSCRAYTAHSLGNIAIRQHYGNVSLDNERSLNVLADIRKVSLMELKQKAGTFAYEVSQLVSKCKLNLIRDPDKDTLLNLLEEYGMDIDLRLAHEIAVFAVLQKSQIVQDKIDYDDMLWIPIVNELSLNKYDLLFVDEGQDLNKAQQELVLRSGKRIVFCGDEHQAIYHFAGADSQSFNLMAKRLSNEVCGSVELPLTTTYRCSQAVVKEAQKWVPEITAYKNNPQGSVINHLYESPKGYEDRTYHNFVQDGDMIICRNNAPLVSQCLYFIKLGRKAYIRGRKDIAGSLIKLIKNLMKGATDKESLLELADRLRIWKNVETAKADAKQDDRAAAYVADRFECLNHFINQMEKEKDGWRVGVWELITKIQSLFTDTETKGIMLASIHQAKGLEANRVFFLMPRGAECPAAWAKTKSQAEQEKHLRYIGITRAREDLIYVS